jgi:hypothetical protein
MEPLHERLLQVAVAADPDLGLMLAGGYALSAHGILDRPSRDVDLATATSVPMDSVVERLVTAFEDAGYQAQTWRRPREWRGSSWMLTGWHARSMSSRNR